jgi:Uma2 family endonuclease
LGVLFAKIKNTGCRGKPLMTIVPKTSPSIYTLADLLERLGSIPPERVRFQPSPGTATEQDIIEIEWRENRLCELVDGVLVEKTVGFRESLLSAALCAFLRAFVVPRNLGLVSGADGMVRLFPGLVRIPDVAFTSWGRIPSRRVPVDPIPNLAPDLAVEVLSQGNTDEEMKRKRDEYFAAGVRLVWLVDPEARTVTVYISPDQSKLLMQEQTLDGGDVLPSFALALKDLFAELDRQGDL